MTALWKNHPDRIAIAHDDGGRCSHESWLYLMRMEKKAEEARRRHVSKTEEAERHA